MVHVPPDSRLLVSLVKQEQICAAQLNTLLNASGSALSSLALYASSSPPAVSPILNAVTSVLSGADDALRSYGDGLNAWIDQLRVIESKEDEVVNIGRDREILVTRLLKASQKSKSHAPSLLHSAPDSSSTSSFPTFGSKVTAAQAGLQVCESRLAEKEHELERIRIAAIKQGLKARCGALVQCGWQWGEMGRRALSMLEEFNPNSLPPNDHVSESFNPLPARTHDRDRDSNLSSLTPSQSASQIGVVLDAASPLPQQQSYRLDIPPPHLVSENPAIPGAGSYLAGAAEDPASSSEDDRPVQVHENPRLRPSSILSSQHSQKSGRTQHSSLTRGSSIPFPNRSKDDDASIDVVPSTPLTKVKNARRRKDTGFFESIALLFKTSMSGKSSYSHSDGRWVTRTDRNIRSVKSDGENSSDGDVQPRSARLRKTRNRMISVDNTTLGGTVLTGAGVPPLSSPSAPAPARAKTSGSKSSRRGTIRSTISEPTHASRKRASTLSGSSTVVGPVHDQNRQSRLSVDGRWGADVNTASSASLHSARSDITWKPPKDTTAAKHNSLMSIVASVSGPSTHGDPSSKLEVVRAPGTAIAGLPLLVNHPPPLPETASAPASLRHVPITPKRSSSLNRSISRKQTVSAMEKKPLRSAMRSPNNVPPSAHLPLNAEEVAGDQLTSAMSPLSLPALALPALTLPALTLPALAPSPQRPMSLTRPEIPSTIMESPRQSFVDTTEARQPDKRPERTEDATGPQTSSHRQSSVSMKTDDSASISSYETGRENFDDEGSDTQGATVPAPLISRSLGPTPPATTLPVSNLPLPNGTAEPIPSEKHEHSSATSTETATGDTLTRRKSVRMSSLPPQVSATPPALDEYEDGDRSPWSRGGPRAAASDQGWKTRTPTTNISWADSSSEEEDYKAAKKALSSVGRQLAGKHW